MHLQIVSAEYLAYLTLDRYFWVSINMCTANTQVERQWSSMDVVAKGQSPCDRGCKCITEKRNGVKDRDSGNRKGYWANFPNSFFTLSCILLSSSLGLPDPIWTNLSSQMYSCHCVFQNLLSCVGYPLARSYVLPLTGILLDYFGEYPPLASWTKRYMEATFWNFTWLKHFLISVSNLTDNLAGTRTMHWKLYSYIMFKATLLSNIVVEKPENIIYFLCFIVSCFLPLALSPNPSEFFVKEFTLGVYIYIYLSIFILLGNLKVLIKILKVFS